MYNEIMENILPNALMIGVNYDLFWTLNPESLQPFVKAFSLAQKNEDRKMWQQGMYIKLAVVSAFNKEAKYPVTPFSNVEKPTPKSNMEIIKERFLANAMVINKAKFGKEGI